MHIYMYSSASNLCWPRVWWTFWCRVTSKTEETLSSLTSSVHNESLAKLKKLSVWPHLTSSVNAESLAKLTKPHEFWHHPSTLYILNLDDIILCHLGAMTSAKILELWHHKTSWSYDIIKHLGTMRS